MAKLSTYGLRCQSAHHSKIRYKTKCIGVECIANMFKIMPSRKTFLQLKLLDQDVVSDLAKVTWLLSCQNNILA